WELQIQQDEVGPRYAAVRPLAPQKRERVYTIAHDPDAVLQLGSLQRASGQLYVARVVLDEEDVDRCRAADHGGHFKDSARPEVALVPGDRERLLAARAAFLTGWPAHRRARRAVGAHDVEVAPALGQLIGRLGPRHDRPPVGACLGDLQRIARNPHGRVVYL